MHGDLHGRNILHSERGWIVIDPKGIVGTPAYDALTMCSYRRSSVDDKDDQTDEFRRRIRIFSEAAEVDPDLSRRCAHTRAVTALLWDLSPGDVPRTDNFELRVQLSQGLID